MNDKAKNKNHFESENSDDKLESITKKHTKMLKQKGLEEPDIWNLPKE